MIVRGIAAAIGISTVISVAAIMGASLAPAWADTDTAKIATMFEGALDESSLEGVRTGLAPAPGRDDEEELRRKRPNSADTDPLKANRDADPLPKKSELSSPFTPTRTLRGAPINRQPTQSPPAATNPPPANTTSTASNPPPASNTSTASNPPPAQSTIPVANNSTLGGVIGGTVTTIMRRTGLVQ